MWKALEALTDAFAPIVGEPKFKFNFKLTIVQQTCHRITIAADSENEALTLAPLGGAPDLALAALAHAARGLGAGALDRELSGARHRASAATTVGRRPHVAAAHNALTGRSWKGHDHRRNDSRANARIRVHAMGVKKWRETP